MFECIIDSGGLSAIAAAQIVNTKSGRRMGKRGRPAKGEYSNKTAVLTLRITPALRTYLERAAKDNRTSLSREVEHRVRRAYLDDERIAELFGSRRNYAVMRMIGALIETTIDAKSREADWLDSPYLFDQTVRAINAALDALRPKEAGPTRKEHLEHGGSAQWKWRAAEMLRDVKNADGSLPLGPRSKSKRLADRLKADLGAVADRPPLPHTTVAKLPSEIEQAARDKGIEVWEEVEVRSAAAFAALPKAEQKRSRAQRMAEIRAAESKRRRRAK